jgi:hypothetical protein
MKLITRSLQKNSSSALPQTLLIVSEINKLITIVVYCLAGSVTFTEDIERIVSPFGKDNEGLFKISLCAFAMQFATM